MQFELACSPASCTYAVRRTVPPVNRRHVQRLPRSLQHEHDAWVDERTRRRRRSSTPARRARRLAFTLFEQGDDLDRVEHVLLGIGFHPTICRESAEWAHERHRHAFDAVDRRAGPDRRRRRRRG